MMTHPRYQLGELTDIDAIGRLLDVRGLTVADVGCGAGKVTVQIGAAGATVTGIEPDPIQAAKNRSVPAATGVTFVEAPAQALPLDDASLDAVFFFRSLHHVPLDAMDAALTEAERVLKPDGVLWIVEPAMTGSHFQVMRPFHDETVVRTAAQAALDRTEARGFGARTRYEYSQFVRYESFDAMADLMSGRSFNSIDRASIETDEVRRLFAAGGQDAGGYVFDQPTLLDVFRKGRAVEAGGR